MIQIQGKTQKPWQIWYSHPRFLSGPRSETQKSWQVRSSLFRLIRVLRAIRGQNPLLIAFLLTASDTYAQAIRSTIITNGPVANRINLVVLSEGYQTNQLGKFLIDATNEVNNLLSTPPYQEYRSYFNAFAISIASVDSGSDHPSAGVFKNTYFNSSYDTFGLSELL